MWSCGLQGHIESRSCCLLLSSSRYPRSVAQRPHRTTPNRDPACSWSAGFPRRCRSSWKSRRSLLVCALTTEDVDIETDTMEKMDKSLDNLKGKVSTIRTGRANPAMLDRIQVDYYGAQTPLKQLAGISVPDSSMLVIQPYDTGAMDEIERAILESDLGINPTNDGKILRLNIPQLTSDRRKEYGKTVAKLGEEGKIAIRNVRRDSMKTVSKMDDSVSEDEKKALEEAIQDLTDDYVKQIDSVIKAKQEELEKV